MTQEDIKAWYKRIDNCNTPAELNRLKSQMPASVAADANISRYVDNFMSDMKRNRRAR